MKTNTAASRDVEYRVRLGTDLTIEAIHPEEYLDNELILSVTSSKVFITPWLHVPLWELYKQLLEEYLDTEHTSPLLLANWVPLFASKIDEVLEAEVSQLIPHDALIKLMGYIRVTEHPNAYVK